MSEHEGFRWPRRLLADDSHYIVHKVSSAYIRGDQLYFRYVDEEGRSRGGPFYVSIANGQPVLASNILREQGVNSLDDINYVVAYHWGAFPSGMPVRLLRTEQEVNQIAAAAQGSSDDVRGIIISRTGREQPRSEPHHEHRHRKLDRVASLQARPSGAPVVPTGSAPLIAGWWRAWWAGLGLKSEVSTLERVIITSFTGAILLMAVFALASLSVAVVSGKPDGISDVLAAIARAVLAMGAVILVASQAAAVVFVLGLAVLWVFVMGWTLARGRPEAWREVHNFIADVRRFVTEAPWLTVALSLVVLFFLAMFAHVIVMPWWPK